MRERRKWLGEVRAEADGEISGFVFDPADLNRRFVVELLADGEPIALMRASLFEAALSERGVGDGCYGFAFAPPDGIANSAIAVIVANTDEIIGRVTNPRTAEPARTKSERNGVRWLGGIRFEAWIETSPSDARERVLAEIDGETVAIDEPNGWAPAPRDVVASAANRYSISLPLRFADGQFRNARFRTESGRELAGSPCPFVAFADPIASPGGSARGKDGELEPLRRESLLHQSVSFRDFEAWRRAYPSRIATDVQVDARVAVILLGPGNLQSSLKSLSAQLRCEWIAAAVSESGDGVIIDAGQALQFLEGDGRAFEFVVVAPSGADFDANALALLASALNAAPSAPIAYADLIIKADDDSLWPLAFPAFDDERLLEQGYPARCFAMRSQLALSILRERATIDIFGLFFSAMEAPGKIAPVHIPEFLATLELAGLRNGSDHLAESVQLHLQFLGDEAEVVAARTRGALAHARVRRVNRDSVSLIVRAGGTATRVEYCLAAAAKALHAHDAEVLLVGDRESLSTLKALDAAFRRIEVPRPGKLMQAANAAVTSANGDLLVLLDPQFGDLDRAAFEELLGRAGGDKVGAVGPLHVDTDGIVVSAGQVLGPSFAVADAFENQPADGPSYADLLDVAHEVSAISAIGMVTRKTLFRDVNGFDLARFRRRFAAVDYCLKLRSFGARIVMAPSARLVTSSVRQAATTARGPYLQDLAEDAELRQLRSCWGEVLAGDPFYNPNLALDQAYSGLAWPPRRRDVRRSTISAPRRAPPGF